MSKPEYILSADNLSKSFALKRGASVLALDAVSFAVREGGVTALVGPDGAGKSTLLRIVAGLLKPDAGELYFDGKPWSGQMESLQESVGYMPQKFGLYEDLSVQENLDLYADLRGLPLAEREERYQELLRMTAMEPFRARLAGKLSGGMKQKLGLICTLVKPPRLLLLDEPTVGVDPLSRRELWQIVAQLTAESHMSVMLSTSYLDEAARCDEVVMLFEGKTLVRGRPQDIQAKTEGMGRLAVPAPGDTPRSLQARILDAPGIIDAVPEGGNVRFVHGELDAAQLGALTQYLRGAEVRNASSSLEDSFMLLLHEHLQDKTDTVSPTATQVTLPAPNRPPAVGGDEPVIRTEHVFRYFGDFAAVNDVSFSVQRGEVFGLLGPNGAGKTTTFRMLCGLLPASQGNLFVAGINVRESREEARRHLGYVAQKFSLYGPLSVRENLEFFAGAYGIRGAARKERLDEVVADFSLERYLDMPAGDLPGGYKQRLSMAVGLLHKPAILFLDEPTSGADPLARRGFWKRISGLAEQGVTIVVTTHFMEEAEYCDRVLIQDSGRMLALGAPADIRAQAGAQGSGQAGRQDAGLEARPDVNPDVKPDTSPDVNPETSMEDAFIAIVARARQKNGDQAHAG